VLAHDELLVRSDFQIGTRKGCAQEDESGVAVLREVGDRIACIELSGLE